MNQRDKKNLVQTAFAVPLVALVLVACGGAPADDTNYEPSTPASPNPAKTGWVDFNGVKFRCNGYTGIYVGTTSDGATVDIEIKDDDGVCYE